MTKSCGFCMVCEVSIKNEIGTCRLNGWASQFTHCFSLLLMIILLIQSSNIWAQLGWEVILPNLQPKLSCEQLTSYGLLSSAWQTLFMVIFHHICSFWLVHICITQKVWGHQEPRCTLASSRKPYPEFGDRSLTGKFRCFQTAKHGQKRPKAPLENKSFGFGLTNTVCSTVCLKFFMFYLFQLIPFVLLRSCTERSEEFRHGLSYSTFPATTFRSDHNFPEGFTLPSITAKMSGPSNLKNYWLLFYFSQEMIS